MKNLVVLSGAGISAESGIATFRDFGGLWDKYRIEDVATPEAFRKNPKLVLDFYNMRRRECIKAQPNRAHIGLAELENDYNVFIITQNVDDLHEKAGSKNVLHLHGELMKARSSMDSTLIYDLDSLNSDIQIGDQALDGSQLRPHIVWFGESVPMMEKAQDIVAKADILVIIGTSLNVYPAAGLVDNVSDGVPIYLIDPNTVFVPRSGINFIQKIASEGVGELIKILGSAR